MEWRASPAGRYNRNATVSNSDFSFIGGNAVVAWGCAQRPLGSHRAAGARRMPYGPVLIRHGFLFIGTHSYL